MSPAKAGRSKTATATKAARADRADTAPPPAALRPEQFTLRPRPEPSPEALAVIAAAAQLLWTRPAAPEAPHPAHDAWRFSGRWWAQPALVRRARPWARP